MELIIKILADYLMAPIVLLAAYALLCKVDDADRYDRYTRIFMAGITSYLVAKYLGAVWQPEQLRPFEQMGVEAGASYLNNPGFPSDHALFVGFLASAVWYGTRHKGLAVSMAILAVCVCAGRVAALVHTPLDVIGGLAVACIGGIWYIEDKKLKVKRRLAKYSKK